MHLPCCLNAETTYRTPNPDDLTEDEEGGAGEGEGGYRLGEEDEGISLEGYQGPAPDSTVSVASGHLADVVGARAETRRLLIKVDSRWDVLEQVGMGWGEGWGVEAEAGVKAVEVEEVVAVATEISGVETGCMCVCVCGGGGGG